MGITQLTIDKLHEEQQGACALCGRPFTTDNPAQVHHAIYGRNKKFAKLLDQPHNLLLICQRCHSDHGHLSAWFQRNIFYNDKIRAGYSMAEWNENLKNAGMITDYFIDLETGETSGGDA